MAIKGITYDNQGPTALSDAVFHSSILSDGVIRGCQISYIGTKLTIAPGYLISAGRFCALMAAESVEIPAQEGVARVMLQTDLSQISSAEEFLQLSLIVQSAASLDALPALVTEDINGGGLMYQMTLCVLKTSLVGIESIVFGPQSANLALPSVSVSDSAGDHFGQPMPLTGPTPITLPLPSVIGADLHAGQLVAGPNLVGTDYPENPVENQLFFLIG